MSARTMGWEGAHGSIDGVLARISERFVCSRCGTTAAEGQHMMPAQARHQTLPSAVAPMFVPTLPLIDTPISPLAMSCPPRVPTKMRITIDPNMKVSEDDDTLDIAMTDGVRPPKTPQRRFIAFAGLLVCAYVMAVVATLAVTSTPAITLLHQLRAAI